MIKYICDICGEEIPLEEVENQKYGIRIQTKNENDKLLSFAADIKLFMFMSGQEVPCHFHRSCLLKKVRELIDAELTKLEGNPK